ncbi:helix-turn-helix transcriptional regulator [Streptomyces sp. MP131-18]|uniref:helix-turn-helix domain-containing protein n=1 Tax=Streptomyces sp. MP131-18 TaxID=1857892 RepID=UPI00097C83DB|nr:helix-turn-helix transcriptional regulator [Streptomyces sp. MP131-18]ONK11052.1 transcriptional regulator, y4mF family [Streptomyces sp. MP131-18]
MPEQYDDRTGARIAAHRKRSGLTQRGLAQRIPYSYSLLRHVEAGHKAPSPQLVAAVARALGVPITALTGHSVHSLHPDHVAALIRPIREALDLYDLPTDLYQPSATTADLVVAADALCRDVRAARLQQAAAALPSLLADLTMVCRDRPATDAWRALSSAYRSAHDVATKFSYGDLAVRALDRMGWATERASDPVLGAVRQYKRALSYRSRESQYHVGLSMVAEGHRFLAQAQVGTEASAVAGQLHLGAAVIAARADDGTAAEAHLGQARELAARTGEVGTVYWLSFGPANVGVHETFARLELRQFDEAYAAARAVRPPRGWATSRRAAHLVDQARAEMETGRTDAALASLSLARKLAPQQTRFQPRVRETVQGLLHMRRRSPDALSRMATWVGC